MTVKRLVIAVVSAALVAAGCSSGGSGETPEGFVRGEAEVLSVAYPSDWQRGPEPGLALSMQAPGQVAFLSVIANVAADGDTEKLEATVAAAPRINAQGYRQTGTEPIKVAGAETALRIDYTFDDFRGAGAPGQAVDVGVIGENGRIHTVRLTWQRGRLDGEVVDGIVDSIRMG